MMKHIPILSLMLALCQSIPCTAQSVTYNHDDPKMKQIMVMETGAGALTPDLYYYTLHRSYQKTAYQKNKLGYRTLAAIGAYGQVAYADSIDAYLTKRAEIEALNVADREIDLAWRVEGSKITTKLNAFHDNINRIVPAGGSPQDRERWNTYYQIYQTAIKSTREAYMPNAQRKREYLSIYSDICKQNETLVKQLVQMNNVAKTEQLLAQRSNYRTSTKVRNVEESRRKWREAALSATHGDTNNSEADTGDGDETVNR